MEQKTADKHDIEAGRILRALREQRRVTQTELADASGITFQRIKKYERGVNRISLSRLFQMCKALRIKPATFISEVAKCVK